MRTLGFVAISVFAACGGGGDSKPDAAVTVPDAPPDVFVPDAPPDAPMFDFSCASNPAPTTAPATINLSGTAQNLNALAMTLEPVADASVSAVKSPNVPLGTPTTSDAQGAWALNNLPAAMMPVDGFVEGSKAQHQSARVYPPQPLTADQANIPLLMLSDQDFGLIQQGLGTQQDPAKGAFLLAYLDCAGTPISGATATVQQAGVDVGDQVDLSQFQPGTVFVFNVPVGDTVVGGSVQGMQLRPHTIGSAAKTISTTIVNPGFAN